jgi:murein L,D-transpeptidase YcbB/YkuD
MKTLYTSTIILILTFLVFSFGRHEKSDLKEMKTSVYSIIQIANANDPLVDKEVLNDFFKRYPDLKKYKNEVIGLYNNRSNSIIWYNKNKITEFGNLLYQKLKVTDQEGIQITIPYKNEIDQIFDKKSKQKPSKTDSDILLSSAYIIYMNSVYEGLDAETVKKMGWFLPKKKISCDTLLNSLLLKPNLLEKNGELLFDQYYKLQEVLKKYKKIEENNVWEPITTATPYQDLRPDATSTTIGQVRTRLFVMGDLKRDSKSDFYDQELMDGVMKYKLRNGFKPNYIISEEHIKEMNIPITDKIKTLMVNMERCRWISPNLVKDRAYIMVNIPSFEMVYVKNGKVELISKAFVGSELNKTTIFSSSIEKIVFSPYWNIPQSIVENELKFKIASDKDYLVKHNMEIINGQVRQKPGPDNSLGLVKFIFPNPDDIYMHDTPSKGLFDLEIRTFSHGCININKAKELAVAILKDYPEWTQDKIDKAMDGTEETTFKLSNKVPIYICYFTAWVNDSGEVNFFPDVYNQDGDLDRILFPQTEMG